MGFLPVNIVFSTSLTGPKNWKSNLSNFSGIIGKDKAMLDIFGQIRDVALYNYPVHVSGETGTGKERVALAIHDISACGNGAFIPVNCGALPDTLLESELFGYRKGAFTDARHDKPGRFDQRR